MMNVLENDNMTVLSLFRYHSFSDIERPFLHLLNVNDHQVPNAETTARWKALYERWVAEANPQQTAFHICLLKTVAQSGKINVCAGTFCNYRQSNWDCINNENSDSGFVITKIYDVPQLPKKYPISDPIGIYIKKFYWPEIRDLFVEVPIRVQELIHGENLNPLHPESHLTLAGKLFKGKNIWCDLPEITLDEIKEAVEVCHCDVNETYGVDCKEFGVGATPLLIFTWLLEGAERLQIIEYLVNKGADVNFFGYGGHPVLGVAVLFCDVELVKFLLEHGANPNYNGHLHDNVHRWVFDYKSLALHSAYNQQYCTEDDTRAKAKEIFDLLIQHGAEMFVEDIDKNN